MVDNQEGEEKRIYVVPSIVLHTWRALEREFTPVSNVVTRAEFFWALTITIRYHEKLLGCVITYTDDEIKHTRMSYGDLMKMKIAQLREDIRIAYETADKQL